MERTHTAVIGGGAAGILAAIGAARRGRPVVICEKTACLGRKILATGNGRCNLLNEDLDENRYNASARGLVRSVFDRFGGAEISAFFRDLGLALTSQAGRVFPRTQQAASVLRVLEMELERLSVPARFGFDCAAVSPSPNGFVVASKTGEEVECRKVVVAGGGKAYPAFGADGGAFEIARRLGHTIVEPVPAAVPLVVRDALCQRLQGQRISAAARSLIDGETGEEAAGELLFTKYGLSGTAVLDVSESISIALNRRRATEVFVSVDLVPFLSEPELGEELSRRRAKGFAPADMLAGILPPKLCAAFAGMFAGGDVDAPAAILKRRLFRVSGTRGWNEAEFTAGGVSADEVAAGTLESKRAKGVHFAGEILDVDGRRGGYNLAWAWASGYVAGTTP